MGFEIKKIGRTQSAKFPNGIKVYCANDGSIQVQAPAEKRMMIKVVDGSKVIDITVREEY